MTDPAPAVMTATHHALDVFEATPGEPRQRCLAALTAYTEALAVAGVIPTARPRAPFTDAAGAARWMADTSGHPRYATEHAWRTLLHPGGYEHAAAVIRSSATAPPDAPALLREAIRLIEGHGVPPTEGG